jgi:hypothetical protein
VNLIYDTSYFHNPHSPGDELLPLHHGEEGYGVMEAKGQLGAALAAAPSFPCCLYISFVFFVFLRHPPARSLEGIYILGFRSRRFRGVQDCVKTTHDGKVVPHNTTRIVACMVGPLSYLAAFHVDFLLSWSYISPKNDVEKTLGPFDVQKVPESQKHAKTRKLIHSVKTE